ncbi:MAG: hypothetical protein CMK92_13635 [Pseudomonas sp.]|nr:hypothetical protein [Pseudomonas sp.]
MDLQIYLAGMFTFGAMPGQGPYEREFTERDQAICRAVPHLLDSYHYVGKQRKVNEIRATGRQIFLDSGAFSAYTLGIELSIEDYCHYINENRDIIRVEEGILMASVLDGIGDPLLTYQNQKRMEELGVKPLPCFHANEDERYLDYYVENYEYITLGGMVGASTAQLSIWLDRMFNNHILDGAGRPKTRVHGFGITSEPLMERYPWYSCDSSSWVQTGAFGGIQMPDEGVISVSDRSPSRHTAGQHLTTLAPIERKAIEDKIRSQGFDPERLQTSAYARWPYNIWAYGQINERINNQKRERGHEPLPQELF